LGRNWHVRFFPFQLFRAKKLLDRFSIAIGDDN
jgi:hypothetical protein